MRPTDENQHGSTRPNLMSGTNRHVPDDDNILARLERDSARNITGNRGRAVLQAAAATVVLLVLIYIAWIAYENVTAPQVVPMTAVPRDSASPSRFAPDADTAKTVIPAPTAPPASLPSASGTLPVPPKHDVVTQGGDASSRKSPVAGRDSAANAVPPLVLLRPAIAAKPTAGATASVAAADNTPARAIALERAPGAVASNPPASRSAPRPIPTTRAHQPVSNNVSANMVVDNDVALLSAIIIHDSAHAAEKAQMEALASCARSAEARCGYTKSLRR